MKCPVCEKEMDTATDYMDDHTLLEEHGRCKDEHHAYSYSYAYGSTEESFSFVQFHHSYTFNKELREEYSNQYKAIVGLEREQYRKRLEGESHDN